jgi:hypothetical protein
VPKLDLARAYRIKLGANELSKLKGGGYAWPDAPPPAVGPATWFTPAAPIQITANSAPFQYYAATLAWSHRFTAGQLDFPRPTNHLKYSEGGYLDVQGEDDSVGLNALGQLVSWAYATLGMTFPTGNVISPGVNHRYVMVWNVAGLPGGNEAELWQDGALIGYANGTISDVALYNLHLLGQAGGSVLPGETQGFWWSNDTALAPADVFAELFDGANGLLDLSSDPVVAGVTPDAFQFGPP